MADDNRNEVSHYSEIQRFIEEQIVSNFRVQSQKEINVYWGIGELKSNLKRIIADHPKECSCVKDFVQRVPPLNLDIFAVITDGSKFELLILEIKLVKSAGLKEWSQLVGYCLVAKAKYGLLININNGGSERLMHILATENHVSLIKTIEDESVLEHKLGFMQWDSLTQNFIYSNLGFVKSISNLSKLLIDDFME